MNLVGATLRTAGMLFVFWALLSGKFDAAHLATGAAASVAIAIVTIRLLMLPPAIGASSQKLLGGVRWGRVVLYVPWLAWEIVMSAAQVAYVVLHPRMPIQPRLLRFRSGLPHTLARLTLANSITLTPGTVTLEVDQDDFVVHALTEGSARGLEAGRMRFWVAELFDDAVPSGAGNGAA